MNTIICLIGVLGGVLIVLSFPIERAFGPTLCSVSRIVGFILLIVFTLSRELLIRRSFKNHKNDKN